MENSPNADKPLEYLTDRARRMAVRYVEKGPYRLNPNRNVWEGIVRGIGRQAQTFGWPYCPCQQRTDDPEEDKKYICPCYRHKEDIATTGQCICGLFVSPDFRPQEDTAIVVTPTVRPEGGAWPPITIYGANWCGHSLRCRRFLERRGIPYNYVEVEDNPEGAQRVRDWNRGYQSTPTIDIDGRILTEPSEDELGRALGVE